VKSIYLKMETPNQKYVIITVDTNDGDYEKSIKKATPEQLDTIHAVALVIKEFKPYQGKEIVPDHHYNCTHNFPVGELVREDLGELDAKQYYVEKKQLITEDQYNTFRSFCPYCEYGFHTVDSVKVLAVIGEMDLI
jgi:hypothetical protein